MQRKVNRSDSDYHYGKEKYKRNVYKMMLECKQREVMAGDIGKQKKDIKQNCNETVKGGQEVSKAKMTKQQKQNSEQKKGSNSFQTLQV